MGHCYSKVVLLAAAVSATGSSTMATLDLPQVAPRSDINSRVGRLERTVAVSTRIEDGERSVPILKAVKSVANDIEPRLVSLNGKDIEQAFEELKFSRNTSPFLKIDELEMIVNHAGKSFPEDPSISISILAQTLEKHYGADKLSKWIEDAKQDASTKVLAEKIEAVLFTYWYDYWKMTTAGLFERLKLNYVYKSKKKLETPENLFKTSGLNTLISYACKRFEATKDLKDMAVIAIKEIKYEQEGQQEVAAILLEHFKIDALSTMMEDAMKSSEPPVSVKKIEAGLVAHWIRNYHYEVNDLFHMLKLKNGKDLVNHPLMSAVVMYAKQRSHESELIKLWDGGMIDNTNKLKQILTIAKTVEYSKGWAEEVEIWLTNYLKQKRNARSFFARLKRNKPAASLSDVAFKASRTTADLQPNLSKVASTPFTSTVLERNSVSARLHELPPDAKKLPMSLSGAVDPPASRNTKPSSYSSLRPAPLSVIKEQPILSNEAGTLPATSKPAALPLDAPLSKSRFAKFRRWLYNVLAKLWAIMWPFS